VVMGSVGFATQKVAGSNLSRVFFNFLVNNLGQVVHTHMPLTPSSISGTGQRARAAMPCGWEGNRRSGVALAMHHRLQWLIHARAHSLRKGDEHLAHSLHGVWHSFTFLQCRRHRGFLWLNCSQLMPR